MFSIHRKKTSHNEVTHASTSIGLFVYLLDDIKGPDLEAQDLHQLWENLSLSRGAISESAQALVQGKNQ